MDKITSILILTAAALICSPMPVPAQDLPEHEVFLKGQGGMSGLLYKIDGSMSAPGAGGGGGIGYNWFFSPSWALSTGVEYSIYNASVRFGDISSGQVDDSGQGKNLLIQNVHGFSEKQRMSAIQIPLLVQWSTPFKDGLAHRYYLSFGAKLGFNVAGSYIQSASSAESAILWDWNVAHPEDPVRYSDVGGWETARENLGFRKLNGMFSLETGFRWRLGNGPLALYTGIYLDAGFINLAPAVSDKALLYTDSAGSGEFLHNSILAAHAPHYGTSTGTDTSLSVEWSEENRNYARSVISIACGITVKLSFGIGRKKPAPTAEIPELPVLDCVGESEIAYEEPLVESAPLQIAEDKPVLVKEIPVEIKKSMMKLSNSLFAFNRFNLTEEVKIELDKVTRWLLDNPELHISVEGHTDNVGGEEYNQSLSESRARAVMDYFIQNGVDKDRLSCKGFGKSRPIADNSTAEGRQLNRRVELRIID
ncbi:MAG: OmpA family protein [Candidatus Cryptobacteroides sp.]